MRLSMVQRKKKTPGTLRVIVQSLKPSSSTNQRVLRNLFLGPDVATILHFRCYREHGCTSARRTGCNARKFPRKVIRKAIIRDIFGVDHRGVTNLSAPIWFTGRRHCTVFRHVMQFSLLVLCKKSRLTVILPQIKKKRTLSNVGHRGTKAEKLSLALNGLKERTAARQQELATMRDMRRRRLQCACVESITPSPNKN